MGLGLGSFGNSLRFDDGVKFSKPSKNQKLACGFKCVFCFHPYLGKISNLTDIFQMGWFNHQLVKKGWDL